MSKAQCSIAIWTFVCLLFEHKPTDAEGLYSLPITDAHVYASSTGNNSNPSFVIDEDFFLPQPTCFHWDDEVMDEAAFHWLLIDFGVKVRHVSEIHILLAQFDNMADPKEILVDSYLIRSMETEKQSIVGTEMSKTASLPWDSPGFYHCASFTVSHRLPMTVIMRCSTVTDGRWLAIRTTGNLRICLINLYVAHAFKDCFTTIKPGSRRRFRGSVFRMIRHIPRDSCRDRCSRSADCEAVMYIEQPYSGTCRLVHSFGIATDEDEGRMNIEILHCASDSCNLESNRCNRGISRRLYPPENLFSVASGSIDVSFVLDWEVEQLSVDSENMQTNLPDFLSSVHFAGNINCSEWDCGLLYVYVVNVNDRETMCTFVNTAEVTLLTNTPLLCSLHPPIQNPTIVRLKWKPPERETREIPRIKLDLISGRVRLTNELLEQTIEEVESNANKGSASKNRTSVYVTAQADMEQSTGEQQHMIQLSNNYFDDQDHTVYELPTTIPSTSGAMPSENIIESVTATTTNLDHLNQTVNEVPVNDQHHVPSKAVLTEFGYNENEQHDPQIIHKRTVKNQRRSRVFSVVNEAVGGNAADLISPSFVLLCTSLYVDRLN